MEIAIGAVIAVLAGILTPPVAKAIELWWRNRISVKRITNPKDKKNINQLRDIYVEVFPDGFNAEEFLEYIHLSLKQPNERPIEVDDIWLVAKQRNTVVGFLLCHFYPKRNMAWVSYYGIVKPKELPKDAISSKLLEDVLSYLNKHKCEFLFFDILRPEKNLNPKENRERKARIKHFKADAISNGIKALELKFDYKAPKISASVSRADSQLILMVIPLSGSLEIPINRSTVIDFLDFIYLDCYGDIYEKDDSRYEKFKKHLLTKLEEAKKEIPEFVEVE